MIDLDAYFERIGYGGPRFAKLDVLRALSDAHVRTIPFENIDVLLGRAIDLEPEALFAKLVVAKRGGYCFEQNGLFCEVLNQMGFSAKLLSGRVRLQRPRDFTPPRTHAFVRVEVDGASWLADVGVGAASLTSPLRFAGGAEQETNHEPRRLVTEGGRVFHQIKYGDDWHDVYEFTGEEMPMIDRVVANWFTSAHPKSHFKDRFMVAKALSEGRRATILNREFTIRGADGKPDTRPIESPSALLSLLSDEFGLAGFDEAEAAKLFAIG